MFIEGRPHELANKQTRLYEKYEKYEKRLKELRATDPAPKSGGRP